jgi:hypothetical protein
MGLFKLEKANGKKAPKNGKFINNNVPDEQFVNQDMNQYPQMDMPMQNDVYVDNPIANMGLNDSNYYNQMPMDNGYYDQMPMQNEMYNQGPIDDGMYIEFPNPNQMMQPQVPQQMEPMPQQMEMAPQPVEMPAPQEMVPQPVEPQVPPQMEPVSKPVVSLPTEPVIPQQTAQSLPVQTDPDLLPHPKEEKPKGAKASSESEKTGTMSIYEEPKKEETKEEKAEVAEETLDESVETLEEDDKLPRQKEEEKKENEIKGNPLENDKNPIPVNPVAPVEEKVEFGDDEDDTDLTAKANIFAAIGIIIGMILMPGTTIVDNAKKFRSMSKAISITIWVSLVSLVACAATRLLVGAFNKSYNAVTGAYSIYLDFSNMFNFDNYITYLVITVFVAVICVVVLSLVYYGSSFLNSKGVRYGTYLVVSNLSLIPVIATVSVLYPIFNLLSGYLGIAVLVFSFLYSLITLLMGMNAVLKFSTVNKEILYHVLNLSLSIIIIGVMLIAIIKTGLIELPKIQL